MLAFSVDGFAPFQKQTSHWSTGHFQDSRSFLNVLAPNIGIFCFQANAVRGGHSGQIRQVLSGKRCHSAQVEIKCYGKMSPRLLFG